MSNSAMDNALRAVISLADRNLPNNDEHNNQMAQAMDWLFFCAQMGCKLQETKLVTLGESNVAVSPMAYEKRERKCIVVREYTTGISYHLQWVDANSKDKGFEIAKYMRDNDPGRHFPIE